MILLSGRRCEVVVMTAGMLLASLPGSGAGRGLAGAATQMTHRVLIADEGNGKIHYVNLANPAQRWSASTINRDMQLVGNNRVMVSVGDGFAEYDITTGALVRKVATSTGGFVQSVFRLKPNETWVGTDGSPATITLVDSAGRQLKRVELALNASIRIVRPTARGTFLVGGKVAGTMYECDSTGKIVWQANAGGEPYMALRLPNGNTLISNGYGGQMVVANAQATVTKRFPENTAGNTFWTDARPNFFAGFQVLRNGNIVVANWEGHGPGNGATGYQLLEFDSAGNVVSYWDQDPSLVSSIHGVIVLDDLDTRVLNSDVQGILGPVGAVAVDRESPGMRGVKGIGPRGAVTSEGLFDIRGTARRDMDCRPTSVLCRREAEAEDGRGADAGNRLRVVRR